MKSRIFFLFLGIALFQGTNAQERVQEQIQLQDSTKVRKADEAVAKQWELEDQYKRGTFKITPYQLVYFTPIQWADRPNRQPVNFNPTKVIPAYKKYQKIEAKFQISLKAKIIQGALWGKGDLWLGFTQTANWQIYNGDLSRPFREMNYEPELMFTYPLNLSVGDFKFRMVGLSVNHQSNGKEAVLSRSWNRVILSGTVTYNDFLFSTRFWKRFSEKYMEDDNPYIEDYMGRADFRLAYVGNYKLIASLYHRNNLDFKRNRSFTELTLAYPIYNDLNVMFQAAHGYGSTLVEYNHKQTLLSLGIVFLNL